MLDFVCIPALVMRAEKREDGNMVLNLENLRGSISLVLPKITENFHGQRIKPGWKVVLDLTEISKNPNALATFFAWNGYPTPLSIRFGLPEDYVSEFIKTMY